MTRRAFAAAMVEEIQEVEQKVTDVSGTGDAADLLDVLDRVTALHEAQRALMQYVSETARPLIEQALKAGVPLPELSNRPYVYATVRAIANDLGIPPRRPGPPKMTKKGKTA